MTTVEMGNVLLVLNTVPAVLSTVVYAGVPWHRSPWGRAKMLQTFAIALVLCLGCVRLVFGDSPWFAGLRTGAFAVTAVALWIELGLYIKARREGPTTKEET